MKVNQSRNISIAFRIKYLKLLLASLKSRGGEEGMTAIFTKNPLMTPLLTHYTTALREAAKKITVFFSGPATKALPPPSSLVATKHFPDFF